MFILPKPRTFCLITSPPQSVPAIKSWFEKLRVIQNFVQHIINRATKVMLDCCRGDKMIHNHRLRLDNTKTNSTSAFNNLLFVPMTSLIDFEILSA